VSDDSDAVRPGRSDVRSIDCCAVVLLLSVAVLYSPPITHCTHETETARKIRSDPLPTSESCPGEAHLEITVIPRGTERCNIVRSLKFLKIGLHKTEVSKRKRKRLDIRVEMMMNRTRFVSYCSISIHTQQPHF
jgi:hypothetical protein